jgi:hypothetical protein
MKMGSKLIIVVLLALLAVTIRETEAKCDGAACKKECDAKAAKQSTALIPVQAKADCVHDQCQCIFAMP